MGEHVPEHPGKERDAAHPLALLRGLELELQLGQHGQQNGGADVVQLVDDIVHLLGDAQLRVRLPQNQYLRNRSKY